MLFNDWFYDGSLIQPSVLLGCRSFRSVPNCSDMVIFFEWHQVPKDDKSSRGLPMTGEETDLGATASPMAGYLGKVSSALALLSRLSHAQS